MLVTTVLWPVVAIGWGYRCYGNALKAFSPSEDGVGLWTKKEALDLAMGRGIDGALSTLWLYAAVVGVLFVVWFATKPEQSAN